MKNNSSIFVIVISLFIIIFLIISYFILSDSLFDTIKDNSNSSYGSSSAYDNSSFNSSFNNSAYDNSSFNNSAYDNNSYGGSGSSNKEQVFHLRDNIFKYEDAKAACKAYDARLANLEEVIESYKDGGNWCSYGWSDGQLALYPTQKDFWDKLQQNNNTKYQCGVPGVNGGYFANKNYHFGANCYGVKPEESCNEQELRERDLSRFDPVDLKAARYKHEIAAGDIKVAPFNEDQWSQ
jgi:hypothetical protein